MSVIVLEVQLKDVSPMGEQRRPNPNLGTALDKTARPASRRVQMNRGLVKGHRINFVSGKSFSDYK